MADEISIQEVRHMAMLSRLIISNEEELQFRKQFADILNHVQILQSVDTSGIQPLYSPVSHAGATREDLPEDLRSRSEILANAPETDGECFIVPRIV